MRRLLSFLSLLALTAVAAPALGQTNTQATVPATIVDGSGTITAGGASQTVFAANGRRISIICVNPSTATEPLFVDFGIPATATTGIPLAAGGSIFIASGAIPVSTVAVTAATTGHAFVCKQGFRSF